LERLPGVKRVEVQLQPGYARVIYDEARQTPDALIAAINEKEGARFSVDLEEQTVRTEPGRVIRFTMDDFRKKNLLKGLDEIGLTLEFDKRIGAFEARQKAQLPWLWN